MGRFIIIKYRLWIGPGLALVVIGLSLYSAYQPKESLAVVVPHHNVVQERRVALLERVSQHYQPETIILLSPNHFNTGGGEIITTNREWLLQNGSQTLQPNQELINQLTQAQLYDAAFDHEHGITNLLGEIKTYFPQSRIVPLIFKESVTSAEIQTLVGTVVAKCKDCGVIASVDMSHYKPAAVANMNDAVTIQALSTLSDDLIWTTDVDSHASLAFLTQWALLHQQTQFELVDHTNSGELIGNPYTETTSHIFGYYVDPSPKWGEGNPE